MNPTIALLIVIAVLLVLVIRSLHRQERYLRLAVTYLGTINGVTGRYEARLIPQKRANERTFGGKVIRVLPND